MKITIAEHNKRLMQFDQLTLPSGLTLTFKHADVMRLIADGVIEQKLLGSFLRLAKELIAAYFEQESAEADDEGEGDMIDKVLNIVGSLISNLNDLPHAMKTLEAFALHVIADDVASTFNPQQPEVLGVNTLDLADLWFIFQERSGIVAAMGFLEESE